MPGLNPSTVQAVAGDLDDRFDVAFILDADERWWVVRSPRSAVAAAEMDQTVSLLHLLARRLPFTVPTPQGFVALPEGGRAAVYDHVPGRNLDFGELPAGPGIAAELGRAIAALHNIDRALFDEAGVPAYDADTYRTRRLSDVDRAAATGRVPTTLLARWERALEDVALWRFAPTPVHGNLLGSQVLAVFAGNEAGSGRIRGIIGWEGAKVADPADDFAAIVAEASPDAVDTVLEAYAQARHERPDRNLLVRARLVSELRLLAALMKAVASGDRHVVEEHAARLRRLDDDVHSLDNSADPAGRWVSLDPIQPPVIPVPPAVDLAGSGGAEDSSESADAAGRGSDDNAAAEDGDEDDLGENEDDLGDSAGEDPGAARRTSAVGD